MKNAGKVIVNSVMFILGIVSFFVVLFFSFTASKVLTILFPILLYTLYTTNNSLLEEANELEETISKLLKKFDDSIDVLFDKADEIKDKTATKRLNNFYSELEGYKSIFNKTNVFKLFGIRIYMYLYINYKLKSTKANYEKFLKNFKNIYKQFKQFKEETKSYSQEHNTYMKWLQFFALNDNFTETELKKSFKIKVKLYHPDNNRDNPNATEEFKKVSAGYDFLLSSIQQ